jgi:hypothetical protein
VSLIYSSFIHLFIYYIYYLLLRKRTKLASVRESWYLASIPKRDGLPLSAGEEDVAGGSEGEIERSGGEMKFTESRALNGE